MHMPIIADSGHNIMESDQTTDTGATDHNDIADSGSDNITGNLIKNNGHWRH